MKVKELREILELIDGECEVLVVNDRLYPYSVIKVELDPYFENETENREMPLCIKIGY